MRDLLRVHGSRRIGGFMAGGEALVRFCCRRLVPSARVDIRRAGEFGVLAARISIAGRCRR
ncbi:hypothetical protein GCM10011581_26270 [Saccharopolyspora subtropica]|uniref:Uncharacterized protein n=1 Tax=Saccharopolyspora thermophila TaxID=89367 RepID=A0A917NCW2_9PSEU|nr:hypothetical protein [Saccharopolyspora subtropica]GGI87924.1 hypothetical protein GCM10011581_26270 [Saccharopolyspora subtropica]